MLPDLPVHRRLSELRLVNLVMPVFSIEEKVDHYVLLEFLPILHREFEHFVNWLNILPVHMNHRDSEPFNDVRTVPNDQIIKKNLQYLVLRES